jgi:hypothetical protein
MTVAEAVAACARLNAMFPTAAEITTRMRRRRRQGWDPTAAFFIGWDDAVRGRIRMVAHRCSP